MEAAVSPDRSKELNAVTGALPAADADIQLDYVGNVANAAEVIAALYRVRSASFTATPAGPCRGGGRFER